MFSLFSVCECNVEILTNSPRRRVIEAKKMGKIFSHEGYWEEELTKIGYEKFFKWTFSKGNVLIKD